MLQDYNTFIKHTFSFGTVTYYAVHFNKDGAYQERPQPMVLTFDIISPACHIGFDCVVNAITQREHDIMTYISEAEFKEAYKMARKELNAFMNNKGFRRFKTIVK